MALTDCMVMLPLTPASALSKVSTYSDIVASPLKLIPESPQMPLAPLRSVVTVTEEAFECCTENWYSVPFSKVPETATGVKKSPGPAAGKLSAVSCIKAMTEDSLAEEVLATSKYHLSMVQRPVSSGVLQRLGQVVASPRPSLPLILGPVGVWGDLLAVQLGQSRLELDVGASGVGRVADMVDLGRGISRRCHAQQSS